MVVGCDLRIFIVKIWLIFAYIFSIAMVDWMNWLSKVAHRKKKQYNSAPKDMQDQSNGYLDIPPLKFQDLYISGKRSLKNSSMDVDEYVPNVEISINKYNSKSEENANFYKLSNVSAMHNVSYVPVYSKENRKDNKTRKSPRFVSNAKASSVANECRADGRSIASTKIKVSALDCNALEDIHSAKNSFVHRMLRKAMAHHRCYRQGTRFEF